ncbi:MAG: hypothetical protein AAGB22_01555 [Bacteroidota bacterium]
MESEDTSLKEQFEQELEQVRQDTLLSPAYRRKKFMLWLIRNTFTVVLCWYFWEYTWVRWTLVVYVPLSLFSLLSIFGWNVLINRKIRKTERKIAEAEWASEEADED